MAVIAQQEAVHNESYSYVLSSVVSLEEQNLSFELGRKDPVLLDRNKHVTEQYNLFVEEPTIENILKVMVYTALLEGRSEEHTSELQSRGHLVCRLLLEKKKKCSINNEYYDHE